MSSDHDHFISGLPGPLPTTVAKVVAAPGPDRGRTPIGAGITVVTEAATEDDNLLLMPAVPGRRLVVINATDTRILVYPQPGEQVRNEKIDDPNYHMPQTLIEYICGVPGRWDTLPSPAV